METHHYRLGLLKKYVSEVLFVGTKRIKKDTQYRNATAAIGAALAGLFAALAQIGTAQWAAGDHQLSWRFLLAICIGVIIYVFKDRIKDVSKDYFNSHVKQWLPDFEVQLFHRHYDPNGHEVQAHLGDSQEFVYYLNRESVPPDVRYMREIGHRPELEPERLESVIHYNKRMHIHLSKLDREQLQAAHLRQIHDVFRFDISRFLAKLDNPHKKLSYFDTEKGVVCIDAPKIYHLNFVFRYRTTHRGPGNSATCEVEYERIRMVINKKGIVRLETVMPRGRLGYSEVVEAS